MPALDGLRIQGRGRIPLTDIEAIVAARLGPGRVPGNAQPAAFSRQVAMYLASRVGKWSTIEIGKFYNGRDHSTVSYAIARIRSLREVDQGVNSIVTELAEEIGMLAESISGLRPHAFVPRTAAFLLLDGAVLDEVAERIASRIVSRVIASLPATASAAECDPSPGECASDPGRSKFAE